MSTHRPAEIRAHWDRVRRLGCIVTRRTHAITIHHCHSGSMVAAGVRRGMGQKTSDWLVIPLDYDLHVGKYGIDTGFGVRTWELRFGRQEELLDRVCHALRFNAWRRAGIPRPHLDDLDYE